MDNNKLDLLRSDINSLDDKILDLLKQRAEIVTEIGEQKKSMIDVVDIEREQKVLDRILQHTKAKYSKDSIVRIWREIFQASTKLQEIDRPLIDSKRSINLINIYKGGKSSLKGKDNIIKLYIYGKSRNLIKRQIGLHKISKVLTSLDYVVNNLWKDLSKFDCKATIIFAPACASFDQFENFEKRGNYFNKLIINKIKK